MPYLGMADSVIVRRPDGRFEVRTDRGNGITQVTGPFASDEEARASVEKPRGPFGLDAIKE